MKKTISIISLIIITGLQAQSIDIASIGKELAFKLTRGVSANFAYMNSNLPQEGFVTQQGDVKPHESPEVSGRAAAGISAFDNVTDAQPLTKINKAFSHLDNAGLNRINTALGKAGGGIHTEFGELLVKLSEGNTQILAQIAGSSWEQKLTKLTTDLANAPPFKTRLLQKPELIGAWGVLDDVSPSLRKNIDELDFIDNHLTTNNKTVSQLKAEIQNTPGGYSAWKLAEARSNLLTKLDDFTALKTWVSELDEVVDANLISKLDDLDALYLEKLNTDIAHNIYGVEIKALLKESPDDLTNIWKALKDNPYAKLDFVEETTDPRWLKWKDREFFRAVMQKGMKFNDNMRGIIKNKLEQYGVDLSGFKQIDEFHLIGENGKKIIMDNAFVKRIFDAFGEFDYYKVIYNDNKFSNLSDWTPNQKTEIIHYFKNDADKEFITLEIRTITDKMRKAGIQELKQGDRIRLYRQDVYKTLSNGDNYNPVFQKIINMNAVNFK